MGINGELIRHTVTPSYLLAFTRSHGQAFFSFHIIGVAVANQTIVAISMYHFTLSRSVT